MPEATIDEHDPLTRASDEILVVRAVDGDVLAFEAIARRHGPLMRAYAAKLLSSDAESDDVVQDAFLTAWRRLPDLEDPTRVRSWLLRIVSNRSVDRLRTRRNHGDVDEWDPPAPSRDRPDEIVETRMKLDAVGDALDKLPATQRRCWLLRETAGYSYAEIAEAMDLPVATVRGMLARARRFLLTEMEGWR